MVTSARSGERLNQRRACGRSIRFGYSILEIEYEHIGTNTWKFCNQFMAIRRCEKRKAGRLLILLAFTQHPADSTGRRGSLR